MRVTLFFVGFGVAALLLVGVSSPSDASTWDTGGSPVLFNPLLESWDEARDTAGAYRERQLEEAVAPWEVTAADNAADDDVLQRPDTGVTSP